MAIRALIVDDSSVMRKIVERSLRQAGIDLSDVFQAGNGAEALGVLRDSKVDLILCDINMPVMDGLEFIKQLPGVENAKGVPVVMITTEGSESHVVQALSCGARGYIRKPFMLDCRLTTSATADETKLNVTAMVGLAGQLCGLLSVRCNQKAAALMTSKMLGVARDRVGPEVADALGEVCNMVAGNFKTRSPV